MGDRLFSVEWPAGKVLLHAKDEKRAIEVALQYLSQPEAKRIKATPVQATDSHAPEPPC